MVNRQGLVVTQPLEAGWRIKIPWRDCHADPRGTDCQSVLQTKIAMSFLNNTARGG